MIPRELEASLRAASCYHCPVSKQGQPVRTGQVTFSSFLILTDGFPLVSAAQIAVSPPCSNACFSGEQEESGLFGEVKMNCKRYKAGAEWHVYTSSLRDEHVLAFILS